MRVLAIVGGIFALFCANSWACEAPKSNRVLVSAIQLEKAQGKKFRDFYGFTEAAAERLLHSYGSRHYSRRYILRGKQATIENFLDTIEHVTENSNSVIDIVLSLHGSQNALGFWDGWVDVEGLSARMRNRHRIRSIYSAACFGANHAREFVKGGVMVATGTRGVCTNDAFAMPKFLSWWTSGARFDRSVTAANNPYYRHFFDRIARIAGWTDVDSYRLVYGNGATNVCGGWRS